ncbi:MAG: SPW repeat protein [Patescibacteria group bacterium]
MKFIHWILFALGSWIILVPFLGDEILSLLLKGQTVESLNVLQLLRWDDLFLGLAIVVLSLIAVTLEQGSKKTPGLKAMHWLQVGLGAWIATAPFALEFTYKEFTWSHFVTGLFVAIFALMQVTLEEDR